EYLNIKVTGSSRIAVLGSGSVSQGAFCYLSKLGAEPRMFYRKTLDLFYDKINEYEIIVNGIEIDSDDQHIIDYYHLSETSDDVLIIDAAADAGRSIEGTEYMSLDNPMGYVLGRKYILVNNAPTLMHEISSRVISGVVASVLLQKRIL
ncbi:MAG: N(5)-(carboxyethyl)ornithine synthase, partial [Bacteroidetes bacterium]|nr:N(5)-(carboxyethyl)ornithine synthase [Bacteroidota bacterium]